MNPCNAEVTDPCNYRINANASKLSLVSALAAKRSTPVHTATCITRLWSTES